MVIKMIPFEMAVATINNEPLDEFATYPLVYDL